MNLVDVMDEVASKLDTIVGLRVFAWPVTNVQPPTAVVLFPQNYKYDLTYGRGNDRMTLQVAAVVGRATERTSRDTLSAFMSGSGTSSFKAKLDGPGSSYDECRVTGVDTDVITMNGVDFWGAVFDLDITGNGS